MGKYDDLYVVYGKPRNSQKKPSVLGYIRDPKKKGKAVVLEHAQHLVSSKGYEITGIKAYNKLSSVERFNVRLFSYLDHCV